MGGKVSIAAICVGLLADSVNVLDTAQIKLLGKSEDTIIKERYAPEQLRNARKAVFLRKYAELCFEDKESNGAFRVADTYHIDFFSCGTDLLAARVVDSEGKATMSEIDLPAPKQPEPITQNMIIGQVFATDTTTTVEPGSSEVRITHALCQRFEEKYLRIKYQLSTGACMDELIDIRTGDVAQREMDTSCSCETFKK